MKSKYFLSVLVLIGIVAFALARISKQKSKDYINYQIGASYEKEWEKVDSLTDLGLPRSALNLTEQIYQKALKDQNHAQIIKAMIYKTGSQYSYEEEAQIKNIMAVEEAVTDIPFPAKPVAQSILADFYWRYYQIHRYRILERTATVGFDPDDIQTWDASSFVDKTIDLYLKSIRNADSLQRVRLEVFDAVLTEGKNTKNLRPTLYDFLAHKALGFFMNSETSLSKPAYQFNIRSADYFLPTKSFIELNIKTKDSTSLHQKALLVLQDLLAFHLKDKDVNPLVDDEIIRLKFVKQNSVNELKDSLYLNALRDLESRYPQDTIIARVGYEIAVQLQEQGNKYDPETAKQYQWLKKQALEKCNAVIEKFPGTLGAKMCQGLRTQIKSKSLTLTVEKVNVPGKPFRGLLQYQNLDSVFVRIVPLSLKEEKDLRDPNEQWVDQLDELPALKQWKVELPNEGDYNTHSTEIKIPALDIGRYYLLVGTTKNFSHSREAVVVTKTFVSNISYQQRRSRDQLLEFYVFHRSTGEPLKGVDVQTYYETYDYSYRRYEESQGASYKTDKDGYFQIPPGKDYRNLRLEFSYRNDHLNLDDQLYIYRRNDYSQRLQLKTFFFLDRAIYRPGQTVYFKGLVLQTDGETNEIQKRHSATVELLDVNNQKVSELKVTSNDYGTFSGTFTLPTGGLNGTFYIKTASGSKTFRVEDYKRPRFEVLFDPISGSFRLDDAVTVKGTAKAYAGSNIDHAQVQYRIERQARFPWWGWYFRPPYPSSQTMEIANGVAKTDEKGQFEITFNAIPDLSIPKKDKPVFNYTVYVDVTDVNGETQSNTTSVSVGYVALQMEMGIEEVIDNSKEQQLELSSKNLNGEFEPAEGTVKIYRLKSPNGLIRDRLWSGPDYFIMDENEFKKDFPLDVYDKENEFVNWEKGDLVFETAFNTEEEKNIKLKNVGDWKSGKYVIELVTKDKYGTPVEMKKYVTVYDPKKKDMPYKELGWFHVVKGKGEPGEKAKFLIGSSARDVKVLYEIILQDAIVCKQWIDINDEVKTIELPIEEKYRGNVAITLSFVKYNRSFSYHHVITVPYTNKELTIETETFRDKLKPGQKEQWRFKISGPKGEQVAAEMLAGMYDASLDAFAANNWNLSLYNSYYYYGINWAATLAFNTQRSQLFAENWNPRVEPVHQEYNRLNWFLFSFMDVWGGYYRGASDYKFAKAETVAGDAEPVTYMFDAVTEKTGEFDRKQSDTTVVSNKNTATQSPTSQEVSSDQVVPRRNLQETAFFFPDLKTDEDGKIIVSFTIPEALTRWKFMGMAHTQDLKLGFITKETVTQKELMVMPNAPRFLRENDEIQFTAKVSNLAEKDLAGNARLYLFDALTMEPVDALFKNKNSDQHFQVKQGQSSGLSWTLQVPEGIQAVVYRVVATAENFSDGEENALPVLTNRMLVTETLPLNVRSGQTRTFTLDKLINSGQSKTLRNQNLTLEVTSNPAWYAVQALPYLMEYPYECSEQVFNRYYANALASGIANSNPRIEQVFESWKNTDALLSNLEKNQELKNILLEETPWVLQAQDETERKKRVGLLFDLNKMSNEKQSALRKLQEAQTPNGGWPWFKGMRDNRYITQYIITGLGKLRHLGVLDWKKDDKVANMLKKGVKYLDERIYEDFEDLKKRELDLDENHLGYTQIQYLYARTFFKDIPFEEKNRGAFQYYKQQAEKYWLKNNKYAQGMIAIALRKEGDTEIPQQIINSLKETALHHEELGMYWKENRAGYYWYQAPLETQALLIEAFDEVTDEQELIDEMRIWLLKQKQTQDWGTTKATADACYALLLEGTEWLSSTELPEVTVGEVTIDPFEREDAKVEAGTGYYKTSWSAKEIDPEMGKVTITKKDKGISWGALYWQYFEQLDKITPHETPLKLKKQLFLQKPSDTGPVITPIDEKTILKPGDLVVVRIELRVDRAMEFVHMKDMRASGFEPVDVLSGYRWQGGLGYYQSTRDAATNFFFDWLPKGTYVFEYNLRVAHRGDFSNGITTIQCMYAPEFASHSEGVRVKVGK